SAPVALLPLNKGGMDSPSVFQGLSFENFGLIPRWVQLLCVFQSVFPRLLRWLLVQGREVNLTQGHTRLDFLQSVAAIA
ncbi:hypothetical protein BGU93_19055, partial [Clostridioides difficile]